MDIDISGGGTEDMNLLGAGVSLLSGLMTRKGARQRNVAQIASAQRQMDFQERMSSSAVQRQVADMRQAGINPIMAARYGGSSTPVGAQASIEDELGPSVASAKEGARVMQELKLMKENAEKARMQANQAFSASQYNWASEALTRTQEENAQIDQNLKTIQQRVAEATSVTTAAQAKLRLEEIRMISKYYKKHPDAAMYQLGLGNPNVGTLANITQKTGSAIGGSLYNAIRFIRGR